MLFIPSRGGVCFSMPLESFGVSVIIELPLARVLKLSALLLLLLLVLLLTGGLCHYCTLCD
jgi:hypothetical protein